MKKTKIERLRQISIDLLIGIIFAGGGAYAATTYYINSNNVEYKDNSNLGVTTVQAAIDGTCTKIDERLSNLESTSLDKIYPIGSIYISTSLQTADKVAAALGGTWESYGKGKTLIGVDESQDDYSSAGSTGGSTEVKLSSTDIPSISISGNTDSYGNGYTINKTYSSRTVSSWTGSHSHSYIGQSGVYDTGGYATGEWSRQFVGGSQNTGTTSITVSGQTVSDYYASSISGVAAHSHPFTAKYTNSSQTKVNVTNPYITVYMYKRTA